LETYAPKATRSNARRILIQRFDRTRWLLLLVKMLQARFSCRSSRSLPSLGERYL